MKVTVTLEEKSYDDTMKALKRFGKDAEKVVKGVVDATALAVETDAKNKLLQDKHIITNRLRASVHAELKPGKGGEDGLGVNFGPMEAIAGTNVTYAPHIEFGTKAHIIEPKNKPYLHFKIGDKWIRTKRVNHPGFKGSSFMRFAAEQQKPKFEKRMRDALNKLINAGAKK